MSVRKMLSEASSRELTEWEAFFVYRSSRSSAPKAPTTDEGQGQRTLAEKDAARMEMLEEYGDGS